MGHIAGVGNLGLWRTLAMEFIAGIGNCWHQQWDILRVSAMGLIVGLALGSIAGLALGLVAGIGNCKH